MSKETNPWKVVKVLFADDQASLDNVAGVCNELHNEGCDVSHTTQVTIGDATYLLIFARRRENRSRPALPMPAVVPQVPQA